MNNIKSVFTIKDLENIAGVKAHTIRIWEKRYNLLTPERTDTNIRSYSSENLQKLLNVVLLNNHNFKISKIALMSDEAIKIKARELAFAKAVNDEALNSLKLSMFQFDKVLFNNTYNVLLHKKTFREVFKEVFIPFLDQIGVLWQTDTLLPAHEHFISNLISQKIQINIEKLDYTIAKSSITYVLFLPENEIHELGLMYLNYELALRGFSTIYLGQSLPIDNLSYFIKNESQVCFVTSLTVKPFDDDVLAYFKSIDKKLKETRHRLIAFGRKTTLVESENFSTNISLHSSLSDLLNSL